MIYTDGKILVGTHEEELHQFAESIGLKRSWYQDQDGKPHYDLFSGSIKQKAIGAGAVLVPSKTIASLFLLLDARKSVEAKANVDQKGFSFPGQHIKVLEELDSQLNSLHL